MAEDRDKDAAGAGKQESSGDLKAKCDAIGTRYDEMVHARRVNRWVRLAVMLLILLTIVGQVWRAWMMIKRIDKEEMMRALRPHMQTMAENTRRDLQAMAKRLIPIYRDELTRQFNAEWPAMQAELLKEAELMRDNIARDIPELIDVKLQDMAKRQENRIREEFGITDDKTLDRVIKNLETSLRGAYLDVVQKQFEGAEVRLAVTSGTLVKFLPPDRQEGFENRIQEAWNTVFKTLSEKIEGSMPKVPAVTP